MNGPALARADGGTIVLWIVAGMVLLAVLWLVAIYNRFVRLAAHIRESWADIDVELKRRYDLIPNLVETVQGYARHERDVLERLTALRAKAQANHGTAAAQAVDEQAMLLGLRQVFAVAEAYPQLRADAHFLALQKELALTEDRIAAARRYYNGNVREYRNLREQFPTSVVAKTFGFTDQATFFELDDAVERVVPRVGA